MKLLGRKVELEYFFWVKHDWRRQTIEFYCWPIFQERFTVHARVSSKFTIESYNKIRVIGAKSSN